MLVEVVVNFCSFYQLFCYILLLENIVFKFTVHRCQILPIMGLIFSLVSL